MKMFFVFISLAGAIPAHAQQQQTPMEQALSMKLLAEVNTTLQCTAAQVTMQGQFQAAQARIKDLETKYEPKAEPSK
jgi:hypothetical protein